MTDELVEAVARAIADPEGGWVVWAHSTEEQKNRYRVQATAALQAIEAAGYWVVPVEATDRMSEACWRKASDVGNGKLNADQELWSAMLSAAPRVGEQ